MTIFDKIIIIIMAFFALDACIVFILSIIGSIIVRKRKNRINDFWQQLEDDLATPKGLMP